MENFVKYMMLELESLKNFTVEVQAQWDGKDSGKKEDAAECAAEVETKAQELVELLKELDTYDLDNS